MHSNLILKNANRVEKSKLQVEIEKRTNELQDYLDKEALTISKTIFSFWKNFEEMCLAMGEHYPSMSFKEIEVLSASEFYRLKSYISKKNKRHINNGTGKEENE